MAKISFINHHSPWEPHHIRKVICKLYDVMDIGGLTIQNYLVKVKLKKVERKKENWRKLLLYFKC